jgi:hypothetical protein
MRGEDSSKKIPAKRFQQKEVAKLVIAGKPVSLEPLLRRGSINIFGIFRVRSADYRWRGFSTRFAQDDIAKSDYSIAKHQGRAKVSESRGSAQNRH